MWLLTDDADFYENELFPDFNAANPDIKAVYTGHSTDGSKDLLRQVINTDAAPDVFAHNLETSRRLHDRIRPAFGYDRSLEVLRFAKEHRPGQTTKSNLILGMGETSEEVTEAMRDLAAAGVDILTMGQYLQPTPSHLPVDRWVHPDEFARHKAQGEAMGISHVEAGPLVRSSYHAGRQLQRAQAGGHRAPSPGG